MDRMDLGSLNEREGLNKDLGIEFVEKEPGRVVMTIPIDGRHIASRWSICTAEPAWYWQRPWRPSGPGQLPTGKSRLRLRD